MIVGWDRQSPIDFINLLIYLSDIHICKVHFIYVYNVFSFIFHEYLQMQYQWDTNSTSINCGINQRFISLSRYNCREEFQIHDSILSANYSVGKISDTLPEHYLVLVSMSL